MSHATCHNAPPRRKRRPPGEAPKPAAAAVRMLPVIACVVITAALAVACGTTPSSGSASPANTPTAVRTSTQATTPAPKLSAELLVVSDLPGGWSVAPISGSSGTTPGCQKNIKSDLKANAEAEASFQDGSSGFSAFDEQLGYLPGHAKKAITHVSRMLSDCGQISLTTGGQTLAGTIGAMSFPAVADQSYAYQVKFTAAASGLSVTIGTDVVMFRKADTVVVVIYGALATPDFQVLQSLVQKAAAKLGGLSAGSMRYPPTAPTSRTCHECGYDYSRALRTIA